MENGETSERVHILGAGNLGAFVAHSLAGIPSRPPITLLLKRRQLQRFIDRDCSINLSTRGIVETRRGFDIEILPPLSQIPPAQGEPNPSQGPDPLNNTRVRDGHVQPEPPPGPSSASKDEDDITTQLVKGLKPVDCNSITESDSSPGEKAHEPSPNGSSSGFKSEIEMEKAIERYSAAAEDKKGQSSLENEGTADLETEVDAKDSDNIMLNLIVTVKAPQTVRALQAVAHRLTRDSTILFLQNGMGVIDEVNKKLFPDERYRPTFIVGVVSHGVYSTHSFSVVHAGEGTIALGAMPRVPMAENKESAQLIQLAASARYLLRTMTRTPIFVAVGFPPTDLLQQQLDKLAVNCIINPLTALIDCNNGALLSNTNLTRVIRLLLAEISLVIKSLPELKNVPNVNMRFDTLRLERLVFSIANTTAGNTSSMLQDLRVGKPTEIDYINGYIVKRGQEMGVHCVMNYMIVHMIKGKRRISLEKADALPFVGIDNER